MDFLVNFYRQNNNTINTNSTKLNTSVPIKNLLGNICLKTLDRDTFEKREVYTPSFTANLRRPEVDYATAVRASKQVSNDTKVQQALIDLACNEAIIVRTKEDAIPIMKQQFKSLKNKENIIVLDINPQMNNGMQKSNTLISRWYTQTNNIPEENLITLRPEEIRTKSLLPDELHPDWKQGTPTAKQLERNIKNAKILPMKQVREILADIKGLSSEEILEEYSCTDLASVLKTYRHNIVAPQKQKGYMAALTAQLTTAAKDKDNITVVIPDDCSLSGSSMLCDSVKIFDNFIKENPKKKVNVIFSPLILGDIAENAINTFTDKNNLLNETYLRKIHAVKSDGTEAFPGIKSAFNRVKNSNNISFEISPYTLKAKHFTETETFKKIDDPILKAHLTYLMQGGLDNDTAQFGGFGSCGTMVITPTEEFELEGKTYAGKIPTNSVGYMEVLGHQAGVLNDEVDSKGKGVFTKGTGRGYTRYCEWIGLAHPETEQDRIPISISRDGTISIPDSPL